MIVACCKRGRCFRVEIEVGERTIVRIYDEAGRYIEGTWEEFRALIEKFSGEGGDEEAHGDEEAR